MDSRSGLFTLIYRRGLRGDVSSTGLRRFCALYLTSPMPCHISYQKITCLTKSNMMPIVLINGDHKNDGRYTPKAGHRP